MEGLAVEEERVGSVACRLVHVDQALDEGIHVVGADAVSVHDLPRNGVVCDLRAFGEDVGTGMPDGCGAGPNELGFGCLEAADERGEVLFVLAGRGSKDAAGVPGHYPEGLHAGDAVNQVAKPAVEMNDVPLTVAELAVQ